MHIKKKLSSFLITMTLFIFNTTQTLFKTKTNIFKEIKHLDQKILTLETETAIELFLDNLAEKTQEIFKHYQDIQKNKLILSEKLKITEEKNAEYSDCVTNCIDLTPELLKVTIEHRIALYKTVESVHTCTMSLLPSIKYITTWYENISGKNQSQTTIIQQEKMHKILTEKHKICKQKHEIHQKEFNKYYTCEQNLINQNKKLFFWQSAESSNMCNDLVENWNRAFEEYEIALNEECTALDSLENAILADEYLLEAWNELDKHINNLDELNKNKKAYKKFNQTLQQCFRLNNSLCFQLLEEQLLEWNKTHKEK